MATPDYTPEQHAAAWAAYYAQQGYDTAQIAQTTGIQNYDPITGSYSSFSAPAPAPAASASTPAQNTSVSISFDQSQNLNQGSSANQNPYPNMPAAAYRQIFDTDIIEQGSVYLPGATTELIRTGKYKAPPGKRETVVRKGNGKTWEDPTLLDWDPKWYRLFVGDVSNDVNERTLNEAFGKYTTYCKCKVVRDRLSEKSKYAFIAFKDPEDFLKAWKEMDGKYVGNRPIRLSKVQDDKYGSIATTQVSGRKARELDKLRKNRGKPLDGRPVPY